MEPVQKVCNSSTLATMSTTADTSNNTNNSIFSHNNNTTSHHHPTSNNHFRPRRWPRQWQPCKGYQPPLTLRPCRPLGLHPDQIVEVIVELVPMKKPVRKVKFRRVIIGAAETLVGWVGKERPVTRLFGHNIWQPIVSFTVFTMAIWRPQLMITSTVLLKLGVTSETHPTIRRVQSNKVVCLTHCR